MPDLIDTDGRTVAVADENVANALSQGWRPATTSDAIKRADELAQHEAYGGIAGGAKALYYGALRGATLGLSDVGLRALGTTSRELKGYQEENPGLSTGAELAGAFLPSFAAPESLLARTPAGQVSHIGRAIVDAAEKGGAGVIGKAVASTAGAAAEGALYGGGAYLSQTAIEDKPLAAEGFLGAMGKGALWAAPVGGALSLGEAALIRARSLFPKAEMTREAARSLDRDATTAISQSMQDGQQMARAARQRIALTEAKMGQSQATEQMTRSMFGAADDASMQNQVVGAAEHTELSDALQKYEDSNAKFEDWIRAEADPDLERALLGMKAPGVQGPGAPRLRSPEFGEVVPPQETRPELGEFGLERTSVGKRNALGTPGPHEPPQMPVTTDLPPLPVADAAPPAGMPPLPEPIPARGKPTTPFDFEKSGLAFDKDTRNYFAKESVGPTLADLEKQHGDVGRRLAQTDEDSPEFDALFDESKALEGRIRELRHGGAATPAAAPDPYARYQGPEKDFRKAQDAFREKLTPDEIQASLRFSRENYNDINRNLRGDARSVQLSEVDAQTIPKLDAIVDKAVLDKPTTTHRAVHFDPGTPQYELKPGDTFHDPGFMSTSYRSDNIHRFGNVHFVIESPAGSRLAPIPSSASEGEWLLPRNTTLKITKREVADNGNVTLHATVEPVAGDSVFTKTDRAAGGTQGGAWYKDASGQQWFGKSYKGSVDRVENEHLANQLYRMFGVEAPETKIANISGKRTMMSKELPGKLSSKVEDFAGSDVKNGFVVDAWLGNRDVLGYYLDNVLINNGKAYRIDNGGATIFKATGPRKEFGSAVTELEGMRDPKYTAGKVFGSITKPELDQQLARFRSTYLEKRADIERLIDGSGLSEVAKSEIKAGLQKRAEYLMERAPKAAVAASGDVLNGIRTSDPGLAEAIDKYSERATKRGLKKPECAYGMCDTIEKQFRESAPEGSLEPHQFNMDPAKGLDDIQRFYGLSDEQTATLAKKLNKEIRDQVKGSKYSRNEVAEDFFHAVSVTKDGIAIDWTANQFADLPVPYVFRIHPMAGEATDTLTGQLRSMQSGLGAGEDLKAMGAPAREAYAAEKAAKTAQAAEHFHGEAIGRNYEGSAMAAAERGAQGEARDRFFANLTRPKTRDAYVAQNIGRAMREEGSHAKALAKVEREWAESGGAPAVRGASPARGSEHPPAGLPELPAPTPAPVAAAKRATLNNIDDFESFFGKDWSKAAPADWLAEAKAMGGEFGHSRDIAKTIVDASIQPGMRKVVEDDAIAAALRKHNGKNVDIGADLATAAKVIGDREAAMADLVDALGADAPPMAAEHAKAYRAAQAEQAQKSGASAARAASDFDAKGGQQTLVDSDITKALRAHDSKSEGAAQRATVSLAKGETKEAAKEAAKPRGALSVAADVGTALEVLHALGVHTPDLSAIPVIGPILSLYLKARAVVGIMGRKGGSIGRSTEGVIASKSAAVRDRVAKATAAVLEVGAKAARKAQPIAGPAGALAYRLFPGDGDVKSKDPRVLYDARMNELARAQQPGALDHAISDRVRTSDPDLQAALTQQAQRATSFLASKAPQKPLIAPMLPGDGVWHPSRTALEQWSRYVAAVHDPAGVLEDLANGHVTSEGAETLRVVYPQLFAEAQRRLLEHAVEYTRTLPYARRVSLSIMFRVPVDGTMSAQHMQYITTPPAGTQPAGSPGPAPQQPAITAPLNLGQQTLTSLERRAGG